MKTLVTIPGIHCASCAALIKDVSSGFPQIENMTVDMNTKKVALEHTEGFDLQKWIAEIESLGDTYEVKGM